MKQENNVAAFFALVRAGLWGDVKVNGYRLKVKESAIDWGVIMRLAEEQSVVGLVADGIERFKTQDSGFQIPQAWALQFIGQTLQLEQRNKAMSRFTVEAVERMYKAGLYPLLVKGQGLAQCYERPLWRSVGDVDFFFAKEEFSKAVEFFTAWPEANVVQDARYTKSFGVTIEPWFVEVHGTLRDGLSTRLDKEIDRVQEDTFKKKRVRVWQNGETEIRLPDADNDVFLVFTHFVRHFYKGGMSVRQLCDWCRLLFCYREKLDLRLLESRIRRAGLMDEWRAFYALASKYLGMPDLDSSFMFNFVDSCHDSAKHASTMALAAPRVQDSRFDKKADRIMEAVLKNGGVEKNLRKAFSLFPASTLRFLPGLVLNVNWLKVKERVLV